MKKLVALGLAVALVILAAVPNPARADWRRGYGGYYPRGYYGGFRGGYGYRGFGGYPYGYRFGGYGYPFAFAPRPYFYGYRPYYYGYRYGAPGPVIIVP